MFYIFFAPFPPKFPLQSFPTIFFIFHFPLFAASNVGIFSGVPILRAHYSYDRFSGFFKLNILLCFTDLKNFRPEKHFKIQLLLVRFCCLRERRKAHLLNSLTHSFPLVLYLNLDINVTSRWRWPMVLVSFSSQELAPSTKVPCNKLGLLHSPLLWEPLEVAHATNDALREKQVCSSAPEGEWRRGFVFFCAFLFLAKVAFFFVVFAVFLSGYYSIFPHSTFCT